MNSSKNMFFFCKHYWCLLQKIKEIIGIAKNIYYHFCFSTYLHRKKFPEIDRTLYKINELLKKFESTKFLPEKLLLLKQKNLRTE
jgi:hypothetical protein